MYPLACKETCRIYSIHLVWKFKPFTYGRGKICVAKSAEEITKRRNNFYVSLVDHNFGNCANENMTWTIWLSNANFNSKMPISNSDLLCLIHNNGHKIFLIKLRQQELSALSGANCYITLGCTKMMWHFPVCKLQYLQNSYHLSRKLVQLTPVELSLLNWSSISTLILSGESTITMDFFSEQFSLQRWSQRVGTNLSKKGVYRACWLQSLLVPFSFWFKFQVLWSSRAKKVPKSTVESENSTKNDHSYEPAAIQHGAQRVMGRPVFRASNRTLPDLPSAWPWEIWVRD